MARFVRFHTHGGPEVLRIEEVDLPPLGPGEVRMRVKALGLNRAEALLRAGRYIETPTFPSGLGLEAAGIVEAVGPGVTDFAAGDIVSNVPPVSMTRWPAYGEFATFPVELVVKHPPLLSLEQAAASWMQYLTAYGALIDIARLGPGEFVVITAASSSVGLAAIQLARRVGAIPIAVTRNGDKRQRLAEIGAAHVVVMAEENLAVRLTEIAGPDAIRVVFDAVGGPAVTALTETMSPAGILIEYGGLSPEPTPFPLFTALRKTLTVRGYLVHEIITDPKRLAAAKAFILDGLVLGDLRPVIAKTFAFDQIVEAHRYLDSTEQFGKIIVAL